MIGKKLSFSFFEINFYSLVCFFFFFAEWQNVGCDNIGIEPENAGGQTYRISLAIAFP